jgi:FtsH-binding integral membrane protein
MTPTDLQEHIYKTYVWLRVGLCLLAFVLPPLLWGIGLLKHIPLQSSMSDYYFAFAPPTTDLRDFPARVVFVGVLFALGFFLILYRGSSNTENWALNVAGLCAVLIALFPTHTPEYCRNCGTDTYSTVHSPIAVLLFVCMAFVAWASTVKTLKELPDTPRRYFRMGYDAIAIAMIVVPVVVIAMVRFVKMYDKDIFIVEWIGIATFSAYWFLKTWELSISKAEKNAIMGKMPVIQERPREQRSLRERASTLLDKVPSGNVG